MFGVERDDIVLCRLDEIPDGKSRGFDIKGSGNDDLFAVRHGTSVYLYRNWCPHAGTWLEFAKDQFLSAPGGDIVCFAHGAHFAVETGECTSGPCLGDYLPKVKCKIRKGELTISRADYDRLLAEIA